MSRPFFIYWNELSIPQTTTEQELLDDNGWAIKAKAATDVLLEALRTRKDCRISFAKGTFHHQIANRSLQNWLEEWVGKDVVRRLKASAVQPSVFASEPMHGFDCELVYLGNTGEGLTRAYIAQSWAWSIAGENSPENFPQISALKHSINEIDATIVDVFNLAKISHLQKWASRFEAWGHEVACGHIISILDIYTIIMYPLDHGYPHIHVHLRSDQRINAKYRIDVFEALTERRPNGLDALIENWIDIHRDLLLTSWRRCENGLYPLKI